MARPVLVLCENRTLARAEHASEDAKSRCLAGSHVITVYPPGYLELSQVSGDHFARSQHAGHRNESCAEATLTRFWKTVGLQERGDTLSITLDSRPLKTPAGKHLLLPCSKRLAATLIVTEWENQRNVLKSHALPMTSLAARAIDTMNEGTTRDDVRDTLFEYLDSDTICFHQGYPEPLVRLQNDHWDPLLTWARNTFDVEILTSNSLLLNAQPEATKRKLGNVLQGFDPWQMAAMERVTFTTKSFIIALALVHGHITAEQAALASQVEVASQIERWGEVEDSHDVDYHDVRRHIGSAACLLASS